MNSRRLRRLGISSRKPSKARNRVLRGEQLEASHC